MIQQETALSLQFLSVSHTPYLAATLSSLASRSCISFSSQSSSSSIMFSNASSGSFTLIFLTQSKILLWVLHISFSSFLLSLPLFLNSNFFFLTSVLITLFLEAGLDIILEFSSSSFSLFIVAGLAPLLAFRSRI
jgi:hypothetical protein